MCKISVVTSIYNGEKYIGETIESIIHQTFTDWEYIIIDNASTDASAEIIKNYANKDSRIRFYRNEENLGISANLNRGFDLARGQYIARTDADDLSYPKRLEKQFQYMEEHSNVSLVGCNYDIWQDGIITSCPRGELVCNTPQEMKFILPFMDIIAASTFFARREFLEQNNILYRPYIYAEDYGLLLDILKLGSIFSLPEALVAYRIYPKQVTQVLRPEFKDKERIDVQLSYLDAFPSEWRDIFRMAYTGKLSNKTDMEKLGDAIIQYAKACEIGRNMDDIVRNKCVQYVYRCMYDGQIGNIGLLLAYMQSPLKSPYWFVSRRGLSLIKKCIL